jgi:hypothetical protein
LDLLPAACPSAFDPDVSPLAVGSICRVLGEACLGGPEPLVAYESIRAAAGNGKRHADVLRDLHVRGIDDGSAIEVRKGASQDPHQLVCARSVDLDGLADLARNEAVLGSVGLEVNEALSADREGAPTAFHARGVRPDILVQLLKSLDACHRHMMTERDDPMLWMH